MLFVGLEVGGTNLKVGLVHGQTGECLATELEPLPKDQEARTPEAVIDRLLALGKRTLEERGVSWSDALYIGVACPGQIDREAGVVVGASNFPSWTNVPLGDLIQERTGRPVTILNDASAAASAEFTARRSDETIAVLTLGTGVGLGIVSDGRVMTGCQGLIEGGHMIIEPGPDARLCSCGQRGCLENYASASAVATIASERMLPDGAPRKKPLRRGPAAFGEAAPIHPRRRTTGGGERVANGVADRVRDLERITGGVEEAADLPLTISGAGVRGGANAMTAADVFAMAKEGNAVAMAVVDETCDYLGLACLNICRLLDPDAILLTGGLANAEGLIEKVREAFSTRGWNILPHECEIGIASTCDPSSSGIVGAAGAAASEYTWRELRADPQASGCAQGDVGGRSGTLDTHTATGGSQRTEGGKRSARLSADAVCKLWLAQRQAAGLTLARGREWRRHSGAIRPLDGGEGDDDESGRSKLRWAFVGAGAGFCVGVGVSVALSGLASAAWPRAGDMTREKR